MKKLMCVALAMLAGVAMAGKASVYSNNYNLMQKTNNEIFNVTFTQKYRNSETMKIETKTIQGIIVTHGSGTDPDLYYWVTAPKSAMQTKKMQNWYMKAPKVKKDTKLVVGDEVEAPVATKTTMKLALVTQAFTDGKIGTVWSSFAFDNYKGVGQGSNKSLSGNMLTFGADVAANNKDNMYGTWKATFDASATTLFKNGAKTTDPVKAYGEKAKERKLSINAIIAKKGAHYFTGDGSGQLWGLMIFAK